MATSRTKVLLAAAAGLLCVSAVAAGAYLFKPKPQSAPSAPLPELMMQLPADAPAVGYADLAAMRAINQPALAALWDSSAGNAKKDPNYEKFIRETGFDYTRDLDRVAFAFWPAPPGAPVATAKQGQRPPVAAPIPNPTPAFAIAEGRFDQDKIKAYALRSGQAVRHGSSSIYEIPGNPPTSMAFLSDSHIALASGPDAVARLLSPSAAGIAPKMLSLLDKVSGAPVFVVGQAQAFANNLASSAAASAPQAGSLTRNIKGFTVEGRPSGDGIGLALGFQCDSAASATGTAALLNVFQAFGSTALSDPKNRGQMTKEQADAVNALLANIKIHQDADWANIQMQLTPQILAAAAQQQSSGGAAHSASGPAARQ
jgi:hypothetical protein